MANGYKLPYTGEEIASHLNRITKTSNPNLLHNWYFANPINQREALSWEIINDNIVTERQQYCIDRWRISAGASSESRSLVEVSENGLSLSLGNSYGRFDQLIENYKDFIGKQATFTVLFENEIPNNLVIVVNQKDAQESSDGIGGSKLVSVTFTLTSTAGRLYVGIQNNNTNSVAKIKPIAAKLELGSTQTLAHQDADGNWVLNEIPDYGEELRKCQRYQVKWNGGTSTHFLIGDIPVVSSSNGWMNLTIATPVPLRATPKAYASGLCFRKKGDTSFVDIGDGLAKNVAECRQNLVQLSLETGLSNLQDMGDYNLRIKADGYLLLDANL